MDNLLPKILRLQAVAHIAQAGPLPGQDKRFLPGSLVATGTGPLGKGVMHYRPQRAFSVGVMGIMTGQTTCLGHGQAAVPGNKLGIGQPVAARA